MFTFSGFFPSQLQIYLNEVRLGFLRIEIPKSAERSLLIPNVIMVPKVFNCQIQPWIQLSSTLSIVRLELLKSIFFFLKQDKFH